MNPSHRLLIVGLLGGSIIGSLAAITWHGTPVQSLPLASLASMLRGPVPEEVSCPVPVQSSAPTACAAQLQTSDWTRYRNTDFAIELMHPGNYRVEEKNGKIQINAAIDSVQHGAITLERLRGNPDQEIGNNMQRGGWKVRDRTSDVYIGSFFNDEDQPEALWLQYVFVRNSPEERQARRSVMIRATVVLPRGNEYIQSLRLNGIADPDQVLSGPEEILATMRFLQFDELNQKRLEKR